MQTLHNNIKIALAVPLATQSVDLTGAETPVDTYGAGPETFDATLLTLNIGAITGTPTGVTVSIVESDAANMAGATVVDGGAPVTVVADTLYTFQLSRSKRYFGVTLTVAGGTTPTVEAAATALLNNWAKPLPIV